MSRKADLCLEHDLANRLEMGWGATAMVKVYGDLKVKFGEVIF